MFKQSSMADRLVTFHLEEIEIGHHLGSGSFASVYSFSTKKKQSSGLKRYLSSSTLGDLTDVTTDGSTSSSSGDESTTSALQDSESVAYLVANNNGLALKTLHRKVLRCPQKFQAAFRDMQNEVAVLSSLPRHPNIITLYGTSDDFHVASTATSSPFIVMERLNESLETALQRWKLESKKHNSLFRKPHLTRDSQRSRIQKAALGAARALHFLHSKQTMYRDWKPQNLGFDQQANIRLFDFGLATRLEDGHVLTDRVGTLRYMAPEVASREPYHLSADVYSFGMVLYEIVTLSKPYKSSMVKADMEVMVIHPDCAPTLSKVASPSLRDLLQECRSFDRIHGRPSMSQLLSRLQQEVETCK